MNPMYAVLGVLVLVVLYFIFLYNRLVSLKIRSQEAEADIDVQLKRRNDLIPNIIESVKGYMKHEKGVLENVTKARASIMEAKTTKEMLEKGDMLTGALKSLFAVSENYPDLKANQNFLQLQGELSDTEDKIMAARRFYNGNVRDLNTALESFPTNIVAGMFGQQFKAFELFEIENQAEKEVPQVKL